METVGSETEAYAIADMMAVSKTMNMFLNQLNLRNSKLKFISNDSLLLESVLLDIYCFNLICLIKLFALAQAMPGFFIVR